MDEMKLLLKKKTLTFLPIFGKVFNIANDRKEGRFFTRTQAVNGCWRKRENEEKEQDRM